MKPENLRSFSQIHSQTLRINELDSYVNRFNVAFAAKEEEHDILRRETTIRQEHEANLKAYLGELERINDGLIRKLQVTSEQLDDLQRDNTLLAQENERLKKELNNLLHDCRFESGSGKNDGVAVRSSLVSFNERTQSVSERGGNPSSPSSSVFVRGPNLEEELHFADDNLSSDQEDESFEKVGLSFEILNKTTDRC